MSTPTLSIPIGVNTKRLDRELDKAARKFKRAGDKIASEFDKANPGGAAMEKRAEAQSVRMDAAIKRQARSYQRLRAAVDPAFSAQLRYDSAVRQVERSVAMGIITQKEANATMDLARAKHFGTAKAARVHAAASRGLFGVSRAGRAVLTNTTNQFADMAVQMEMGTNPLRIMGQQVPQLAAGFGMLGGTLGVVAPLLGVVAAIGFPVAAFLLATGDSAESAAEKVDDFASAFQAAESALNKANASISRAVGGDISALRDMYGAVTDEVRDLIQTLAKLDLEKSLVATRIALDKFFSENAEVEKFGQDLDDRLETIREIEVEISALQSQADVGMGVGFVEGEIADLRDSLAELQAFGGISEQFQVSPAAVASISAARDALQDAMRADDAEQILAAIVSLRQALGEISDGPLAEMGDGLASAEDLLRRSLATTGRLDVAARGVSFDAATASAEGLARQLGVSLSIAQRLAGLGGSDFTLDPREQNYDPRNARLARIAEEMDRLQAEYGSGSTPSASASASAPKRRGGSAGGGGAGGASANQAFDLFADVEGQITALERQIEMIGKTRQEIVTLTAKYDLLDAAKARGLNLDRQSTETGKTLRQEIDAQAAAIGRLTVEAEHYAAQAKFMGNLQQDLRDGFIDVILEGKNFGDVLADIAKQLARAALQAALFGQGPLSAMFGGAGLLSGLFGATGPIPAYAAGTHSAPGGLALVGERGPELVNLPRGSQVIPNHRLGGGGQVDLRVTISPTGEFDARVEKSAAGVAVRVSGEMIRQNNDAISELQRRQ